MARGFGFLAIIGLACAGLLAATERLTGDRIAQNRQAHELRQITELAGIQPAGDPQWANGIWRLCNGVVLLKTQAEGYGGHISALVARQGQQLRGLRVTAHQETPGIADFVARPEDPWRLQLRGRTAAELEDIDVITGATISSDALLTLVHDALSRSINPLVCDS